MDKQTFISEHDFFDQVEQFCKEHIEPYALEWDKNCSFPGDIWKKLAEVNLFGICVPIELGGLGFSMKTYCKVCKMMSKYDPSLAMNVAAINMLCVGHILKYGTQEQIQKYIPGILKGEIRGAWGLTEPEAGSDSKCIQTKGTPIPGRPGFYHLNGEKMFITNAGSADVIVIIGRLDNDQLTAFLVDTNQPGFKNVQRMNTVGVKASFTTQFTLENAVAWHTPCSFEEAISLLQRGRLGIASMALGIAEKSIELAIDYAKKRVQFNRRIADMQTIQNMVADSLIDVKTSELLIMHGAELADNGEDFYTVSSMAKVYCSEAANRVTNRAIQIHGGRGMLEEYHVEKLWRDAKLTEIGEGSSEIQRFIISRLALN